MEGASLAQEPRVAVLLPLSGPLSALLAGDISPLEAVRTTFATVAPAVTVTLYDTQGRPDQARSLYDRAVAADRAQIVIGPATVAELNALPNDLSVAVFALASADPSLVRTNLTSNSTLMFFGSLPAAQQVVALSGTVGQRNIVVVRDQFLPPDLRDNFKRASQLRSANSPDELLNILGKEKQSFVTGIVGPAELASFTRAIVAAAPNTEAVLFSPPPLATRLVLAARIASQAWLLAGNRGPQEIVAAAKGATNRWDADRKVLELYWSFSVVNPTPQLQSRIVASVRSPQRRLGEVGRSGSTRTVDCSCRNSRGEMKKCQDCPEGRSCTVERDNSDDCDVSCALR